MKKDLVQVRKYGDVINTDLSAEDAAAIHGRENVLVNGSPMLPEAAAVDEPPKKKKKERGGGGNDDGGKEGDDNA